MLSRTIARELIASLEPEFPVSEILFLETPKQADHGHFATPVCFQLAKVLRKAPPIIAEEMASYLNAHPEFQRRYTFSAVNGFVNIRILDAELLSLLSQYFQDKPSFDLKDSERAVFLEYVSANPTGPLHIGHGRWAVLGDVMARLLSYIGVQVHRESYINDAGNQIQTFLDSVQACKEGRDIPEHGYHGDYVAALVTESDPVQAMLAEHKRVLAKAKVAFDNCFSETSLHESGAVEQGLARLRELGCSYEKDGALWFRTTDLVMIKIGS